MKNQNKDEIEICTEESRRKFLKQAGKLAVYTPPAMMVMMKPSYATFRNSGGVTTSYRRTRLSDEKREHVKSFIERLMNWLQSVKND
jgi:hypothetical protein